MKTVIRFVAFACMVAGAGCYAPNVAGTQYRCDVAVGNCPDGLACIKDWCVPPDTDPNSIDGGAGSVDMAQSTSGCASGAGKNVSKSGSTVWACAGTYSRNGISKLCGSGYSICIDSTNINIVECNKLSSFFVANKQVDKRSNMDVCVSWNNPSLTTGWVGCGVNRSDTHTIDMCPSSEFNLFINCNDASTLTCRGNDLNGDTENTNSQDGVLCCKN